MRIDATALPPVRLIEPHRHEDARGFVCEPYSRERLVGQGIDFPVVQTTLIHSSRRGTLRGLHFQIGPRPQAKLVQVLRGAVLDVVVDVRRDSPWFGRHLAVGLDAARGRLLLVPAGFAHGFVTLADDTDVLFLLDAPHAADCGRGLRWDDPDLGIEWPVPAGDVVISERDRAWPRLHELPAWSEGSA